MAKSITQAQENDWTSLAAATVAESAAIDFSTSYGGTITIQAFLDSVTAHEGTEFIVQGRALTADEDWCDIIRFLALDGTAVAPTISDNPLASASTTINLSSSTGLGTPGGKWAAIEDATLANSELILVKDASTATAITILDGTINSHVLNTVVYSIAISTPIFIGVEHGIVRVVINNNYDDDGTASSLNWRILSAKVSIT